MSNSHADVYAVAKQEMDKWLPGRGWSFTINNRKRSFGWCSYRKELIGVSVHHVDHNPMNEVINTIRHEIAHALHYLSYVDKDREDKFFRKVKRGKRWMRVIKPHGREWKQFAMLVGATPEATGKNSFSDKISSRWTLVVDQGNNVLEDTGFTYHRFAVNLNNRWLRNRKNSTMNKLFMVETPEWENLINGRSNQIRGYKVNPSKGYKGAQYFVNCDVIAIDSIV